MLLVFTVAETNYIYSLISIFCDWVRFPFVFTFVVKIFGCAICLVSGIATKAAMAFTKSFTIF